jgi:hypothetical protein
MSLCFLNQEKEIQFSFICLSVYLSACLSVCPFIHPFIHSLFYYFTGI